MSKRIYIEGTTDSELSIIAADGQSIEYFDFAANDSKSKKNNIYLCTVSRVEPSLQAAFVDYGEEKKAFLPFDEIHPSYFKIPTSDKEINKESSDAEVNSIDDEKASKKNFLDFYRKYKIQDVIKKDQVLLIQIIKEERGSKGAAVSTFVSLPGRYCVLLPNNSASGGVSKKISNPTDRKRLKQIHEKLNLPDGMSLIIRTNAIGSDSNDINGDFEYLKKLWTEVRSNTLKSKAPKLIYELDSPLIKIIRDVYNKSYSEILISDLQTYKEFKKIEKNFTSNKKSIVKHYKEKGPLLESHGIKNPINSLSQTNVYLKSGSYLVINPTEALTSFDINSGKSTSQKNIEITALNTNLEACEEIYNQVVLRNIAGLIVIDFIDMTSSGNNFKVEKKMRGLFQNDKSRVQMNKISQFGLMEISRQRIGNSVYEIFFNNCPCCDGDGNIKSKNVIFHEIESTCKNILILENIKDIEIKIDSDFYKEYKKEIEKRVLKILTKKIKVDYQTNEKLNSIFEFSKDIRDKININFKNKVIIVPDDDIPENEKNYRRKIKKKTKIEKISHNTNIN
ncbi:Rne/Rng family ribonuclease [Alphaproteobacteria bacterium]|nr:Rne/Rng family ribonuclease [Alphaproteobacteria bacterium]